MFVAFSSATSGAVTTNSDEFPNNNNYRLTAESMYFTDDNGVYWQHSADGPLATARFPLGSSTSSNTFIIPTGTATSIVAYENGPRSITPSYKQLTSCTQPGGLLSRLREHVGSVLRNDPFVRRWNTLSSQASRRFRNRRRGAASQAGGVGTRRALGPRASDPPGETTKPGSSSETTR